MSVNKFIRERLKTAKIEIGDRILVVTKTGKKEGILMPHHEFSGEDILTVKLDNGYNVGIAVDKDTKFTLVKKGKKTVKTSKNIPFDKNKPTISIIGTGAHYFHYWNRWYHCLLC
jgi:glutamyl-tRNA(Gln) amidotransferase subunit D